MPPSGGAQLTEDTDKGMGSDREGVHLGPFLQRLWYVSRDHSLVDPAHRL